MRHLQLSFLLSLRYDLKTRFGQFSLFCMIVLQNFPRNGSTVDKIPIRNNSDGVKKTNVSGPKSIRNVLFFI